jgi:hypothetical protein
MDDFFYIKRVKRSRTDLIDAFILKVRQDKTAAQYRREFPDKIVKTFDQFIHTKNFHSWNIEKEYDIMLYGSRNVLQSREEFPHSDPHDDYLDSWKRLHNTADIPDNMDFYEFRTRVMDLIITNNKYKVNLVQPAGNWECLIRNEDLSREIGKSYLCLATRACIDKCMMKYLEIAASDTVILGDIPTDYRDLFKNNIIEITEAMTDQEILDTIDNALTDRKALVEMGHRFGKQIRTMYGSDTSHTFDNCLKVLGEIISEYHAKIGH